MLYHQGLSPEPAAFENGLAVKWMIEKQISGDPSLNYDQVKVQHRFLISLEDRICG